MHFLRFRQVISGKPEKLVVVAALSVAAGFCVPAAAQGQGGGNGRAAAAGHAPARVIVMTRAGLPDAEMDKAAKGVGAQRARRLGHSNLHVIELPPGLEKQAAEKLARHPHFKFVELDRQVPESLVANDPYLGSQWHLPKIQAPAAWDVTQGSGVTIAILDSGVDSRHPDFAGRLMPGYNFVDGNANTEDVRGHGTKVAGAAAAALNNGVGVASVAGQARILPVRISDSAGYAYWSDVAAGLIWAADQGARVANISFSGVVGSASVLSAARYMNDKGGLVFVSAGNDGVNPDYADPASMIVVAATDSRDARASYSNHGPHIHLAAPGTSIYTTNWQQGYASSSGTSFSAPVTAGVAALVMAANPRLTHTQVRDILFQTAVDLGASGRDNYYGYGRVDAAAAVTAAIARVEPPVDRTAPTVAITAPAASGTVSGVVAVNVAAQDDVGVVRTELRVNGSLVATDTSLPFAFSWDSTKVANGMATLVVTAYDAAGNAAESSPVTVNVANAQPPAGGSTGGGSTGGGNTGGGTVAADTMAPTVVISKPAQGAKVNGNTSIEASATDNAGANGIRQTLYIDGVAVATATGGSLKHAWNAAKASSGNHTIQVVAVDAAGNSSTSTVVVTKK